MLTGKEVTGVLGVQFLETRQENVREGTAFSRSSDRRLSSSWEVGEHRSRNGERMSKWGEGGDQGGPAA